VLLVAGDLDGFTPPANAERLAALLPKARLLRVRHGDHDGWAALGSDPDLRRTTLAFTAGEAPLTAFPERITLPPPTAGLTPPPLLAAAILVPVAIYGLLLRRGRAGLRRTRRERGRRTHAPGEA
jgi:hypothetical protein